jgi:hypothetical protein
LTYSGLIERIEVELREIREIVNQTEEFLAQSLSTEAAPYQEALINAIALNLHSFYTGIERIFEMIARNIDYRQPSGNAWHGELLQQMSIAIEEVRPAVISEETWGRLDEFRRFRQTHYI